MAAYGYLRELWLRIVANGAHYAKWLFLLFSSVTAEVGASPQKIMK